MRIVFARSTCNSWVKIRENANSLFMQIKGRFNHKVNRITYMSCGNMAHVGVSFCVIGTYGSFKDTQRSKFVMIQNLKESLDAWRDQIKNRLEAVDALCFESADSLPPDQYALLREKKNQLTADYDTVVRTVENIHGRHENLLDRIQEAFNYATAQKAANEGVRNAVLDLHSWLDDYEGRARTSRDVPLVEESLNELKREVQLLRMDLDSRLALTKDLENDLTKLSASNPPAWRDTVEEKLREATVRLQRNSTELRGFRDNVSDALEGVVRLESIGASLSRSCDALSSNLRATNARDLPRLREVAAELDTMNSQIMDMRHTAESIKRIPNVTGAEAVDAYVDGIGNKVTEVNSELEAKHSMHTQVGRLEEEFEEAKQRLNDWLSLFDAEILGLGPISISSEKLVQQRNDLGALMEKHKEAMRDRLVQVEKWVDGYAAVEKWLTAKRRMLAAIGVATTDATIANTQLGQIQMDDLNSRWVDLEKDLDEKERNIQRASNLGAEIKALQKDVMNKLGVLEADVEKFGNMLPSEVEARLNMDRKLDHLKNIALSSRNEGDEIEKKLESLLDLAIGAKAEIDQAAPISADKSRLQEHADSVNALLGKITEVEGDFPYVRAVVTERLKKAPDDELQSKLQQLSSNWNPAVGAVKERSAVVAKVLDLIEQFDDLENSIRDNLKDDEDKLASAMAEDDNAATHRALKSMEAAFGRRMADAVTLAGSASFPQAASPSLELSLLSPTVLALASRISASAPGPEANKFHRSAENFTDDCNALSKKINSAIEAAQRKVGFLPGMAEISGFWSRSQRELSVCNDELKKSVTPEKAAANEATLAQLNGEFTALCDQLQELSAALGAKKEDREKLSDRSNQVKNDVNALFMELSDLDPIARNTSELAAQHEQVAAMEGQLAKKEAELQAALVAWDDALAAGTVTQSQWASNRATAEDVTKLITKAKKKLAQRGKKVKQATGELEAVKSNAADLVRELNAARESEALSAAATVSDPGNQAEKLKQFKDSLKNIGNRDKSLQEVCDTWSEVSTALASREREVDAAVQQLGRYEDAYKALVNWLEETEELMENQRPPAADAKVAKAQLHAYDVLLKHIDDKDFRYNDLVSAAHDRQRRLIEAVDLAERLSEGIVPLESWLYQAEKRLNALGKIPADVEKMEEQLQEQRDLDEEIYQKGQDVDRILAIVPMLSALVSVEDANSLEGQANQIASRYETIAHRVRLTKDLLNEMALTVNDLFAVSTLSSSTSAVYSYCCLHFVAEAYLIFQDVDNLEVWLTDMEQKMDSISEIAIAPDDLSEQSNIVGDLVTAVTERDEQISAVIEVARQLCRQASGDEALALQCRMDQLKKR
ncbi:hypothetical protein ANCDUO_00726 [Ancylostoma duodenale]|uniref:Spectrin repeat-containing domain protein n=1 Tax=Ancylostoma duodenale TaxID=51022 RepID=A0A0C2HH29_9BILA|nr:hypothetical protein ANCDUO_00726 [Ancylostoma duodenale]